jgi:hypothetical protein
MMIIIRSFCVSGQSSEMSGGNIGRSRSLVDIRDLHGPDDVATGAGLRGGLSFFSEEEGLALLSQDSPVDQSQPQDDHSNTFDQVTGLLDYESDGQDQALDVMLPSTGMDDQQAQAAMDARTPAHRNLLFLM